MDQESVTAVVLSAIQEFNRGVSEDERIPESSGAVLFGRDGKLDSFGLVDFIAIMEERIQAVYGVRVALAEQSGMSRERNPFRSVPTLVERLCSLMARHAHIV